MKFLLLLLLALLPELLAAQTAKTIGNRAQDQLLKLDVNVAGTPTVAATFGDPANCATSGATICSGTYTATVSSTVNLTSAPFLKGDFLRVGNTVLVSVRLNVDPISSATATSFELSLPIASNLGSSIDLNGTGALYLGQPGSILSNDTVQISGNGTNETAIFQWNHTSAGGGAVIFGLTATFVYQIL